MRRLFSENLTRPVASLLSLNAAHLDFAPTTTKPNPAIKETVLKIGDNGSVSWVFRDTCTGPASTTFFSCVKESPPVAYPMIPRTIRRIPTMVAAFIHEPFFFEQGLRPEL